MKRIALVDCGAIARSFHGPALAKATASDVSLICVDPDRGRAQSLADELDCGAEVATPHRDISAGLDGAIICTPNHLHVPVARELVAAGVAVLSEKPLGTSTGEIQALGGEASKAGVPVMANHTRLNIPAFALIRRLLQNGEVGTLRSLDMDEGDRFGWPAATPAMFGSASGGRGVLPDIGAHALDLAAWWLGEGSIVERHEDDSFGGGRGREPYAPPAG